MTTNTTHAKRFNAQRAAKRALKKPAAKEGVDFETFKERGAWTFALIGPKPGSNVENLAEHRKKKAAKAKPARKAAKKTERPPRQAAPASRGWVGKYKAIAEAASRGELPPVPDFSAETHSGYRSKLRAVADMVDRGDLGALMAHEMRPTHTSPKMIIRYRNFAIQALKVRKAEGRLGSSTSQAEWERGLIATATAWEASKNIRGGEEVRRFETVEQAIRAAVSEMGPRTNVLAVLPSGRRLPVGRVRKSGFVPTEAASDLAVAA